MSPRADLDVTLRGARGAKNRPLRYWSVQDSDLVSLYSLSGPFAGNYPQQSVRRTHTSRHRSKVGKVINAERSVGRRASGADFHRT